MDLTVPQLFATTTASTTPVFAASQWGPSPDWSRAGPIQGGLELNPKAVISFRGGAFVWGDLPGGKQTDFKRIDLNSGLVTEVAEPPSGECAHVVAAGARLLSWSICEPASIYLFDGDQSWEPIAESDGSTLDADAVWTGYDLWFWRLGLRIALPSGATTEVEPAPVADPVEAALRGHLMVLPGEGRPPLVSTGLDWTEVEDAPIGPSGRILAASQEGIVIVNDRWESALWTENTWTRMENIPLRLGDRPPEFITTTGPTIVRGTVGGARLAVTEWQPLIDPYVGSGLGRPDGPWVAVGDRLFQIESTLLARPVPTGVTGLIESQAVPLQALALAIPDGWGASLVDGGTDSQYVYTLRDGNTSCQVAALRGEGGRSLEDKVVVQSAWNGLPMLVSVDMFSDGWMAEVDYATGTSDLVQVSCAARDVALRLAAQVYSPPELSK